MDTDHRRIEIVWADIIGKHEQSGFVKLTSAVLFVGEHSRK